MSVSDPIADMLTRIRNANSAGLKTVDIPYSRLKNEIARVLKKEGFIRDFTTEGQNSKRHIRIYLKYSVEQEPVIEGLKRISKPSIRHYVSATKIPRVLGGMGVAILSTSSGVMTDNEARKQNIGGELLCYIW